MHPYVAPLVRCLKSILLFLPVWIMVIIVFITIHNETSIMQHTGQKRHPHAVQHVKMTLRDIVQKEIWCAPSANITNSTILAVCDEIHKEEKEYYRVRDVKVNSFNHKFLTKANYICDNSTDVIVLIHSLHTYYERRRAIRDTWAGAVVRGLWPINVTIHENIKVAFVLGLHHNNTWNDLLKREIETYGDIIQGDFFEHYHNMTRKSLLGLKWVRDYCSSAKFLIKSDDDMIINFPYLLKILRTTNMNKGIMGPHNPSSRALRKGKWGLSKEEFPFYRFPEYQSGAAYIISADLVKSLFEISEYVPWIFIDDVYITGILAKIIGAKHVLKYGFAYWNSKKPKPCDLLKEEKITATKMTPAVLRTIWFHMLNDKCEM